MNDFIIKDNTVQGVQVKDVFTGDNYRAQGRIVLNAGGPWADLIWKKLGTRRISNLRKTKGVHLLTRRISENALALIARRDRRLFFVIPWENYSLVGTTDTDYNGNPDKVYADASDADYLVSELGHYFPGFDHNDVHYTYAGLRPLVASEKKVESNTSRAHKLIDHESESGIKGLISVMGGKITAYRAVAEEALDMICRKLNLRLPCATAYTPLPGAPAVENKEIEKAANESGMTLDTIAHLVSLYGSKFRALLDIVRDDPHFGKHVSPGDEDIIAQVKYSVERESAMTVNDFLLRRSAIGLGLSQGLDTLETVAREMGAILGWSGEEKERQMGNYQASAALGQNFREKLA
jgi:glycerol-3-phosphate dehydrogenase